MPHNRDPPKDDASHIRKPQDNLIQGTSAAGARALATRLVTFYFRAPVKAFFKLRVDYMHVAKAINPQVQAKKKWSIKQSTPGLLAHAVKRHGWGFIPNQVFPPLLANAAVGAILYTSYLQGLGAIHGPSSQPTRRVYPPPPFESCFGAGFVAGGIQSLVAAPLDALVARFSVNDLLEGRYKSMWQYGRHKLHEIGVKGVFTGYGLSFWKDSLGYGLFFGSFEFVKQQAHFSYLKWYYGRRNHGREGIRGTDREFIRPHYALEPCFLLLAGVSASVSQQIVQYPLSKVQDVYYGRLESIDYASKLEHTSAPKAYAHSYEKTWAQLRIQASQVGGWRKWLYRGFIINTLRQVPSTSAGLIVFELMRRRFGESRESVAIERENLTILLS